MNVSTNPGLEDAAAEMAGMTQVGETRKEQESISGKAVINQKMFRAV